jgi:hypothetical protein
MNGLELHDSIRQSFLSDPLCNGLDTDSLFSSAEIYEAIDEAQIEFALETKVLRDSRSANSQFAITNADPWITIPDIVLEIKRARLNSNGNFIHILDYQNFDAGGILTTDYFNFLNTRNWENDQGTPKALIFNFEPGSARLYPIPTVDDQLNTTITHLPTFVVNEANRSTALDVTDRYRLALKYKALSLLFMKVDSDETEGTDLSVSNFYQRKYEDWVRRAKRTNSEQLYATNTTVMYGGL